MLIDGDLQILGLLSDLDVQKWKERAFLRNSPQQQVVTGAWDVMVNFSSVKISPSYCETIFFTTTLDFSGTYQVHGKRWR